MEKLTKENFWDDCYAKWPDQMAAFEAWFKAYCERVNWSRLFKQSTYVDTESEHGCVMSYRYPEIQDLPVAMQIGIFIQYTFEADKHFDFFEGAGPADMDQLVAGIKDWFFYEHDAALKDAAEDKFHGGAYEGDEGPMMGMSY